MKQSKSLSSGALPLKLSIVTVVIGKLAALHVCLTNFFLTYCHLLSNERDHLKQVYKKKVYVCFAFKALTSANTIMVYRVKISFIMNSNACDRTALLI